MSDQIYIANSQIIFSYRRNLDIRKRVFEFEEQLKDDFQIPFTTIAIPNEVDPSIPRFVGESKKNHSIVQVSQDRLTFKTTYDSKFSNDFEKVQQYLSKRSLILHHLVKSESLYFIGFIVELGINIPESEINTFLYEHTNASVLQNNECRDFSLLYSKEYNTDYFINIQCSKFEDNKVTFNNKELTEHEKSYGVSVILDINSKPLYRKNISVDDNLFEELKQETFDLIKTKNMSDYLKGNI